MRYPQRTACSGPSGARSWIAAVAMTVCVVAVPQNSVAQEGSPDVAARIDAYARALADAGELSGTLLVADSGRVVYEGAFGKANYELAVANRTATLHGVASVTKLLTIIVALGLVDEGMLSLDDPLTRFLPDFPRGSEITLGHLLLHRSGIPHRVTADGDVSTPRTAADMVALARRAELLFPPGSARAYSSAGYSVLARVLEVATGRAYPDLLQTQLFAPAGALHSVSADGWNMVPGRSDDYLNGGSGPIPAQPADLSFLVGAGSVFSTPSDLYAIVRRVDEGGYGELVRTEVLGDEDAVAWNGQSFGYRAFIDYDGSTERAVIYAGNLHTGAADLIRRDIPRILAGDVVAIPEPPGRVPFPLSVEARAELEGVYQIRAGVPNSEETLRFSPEGGEAVLGNWLLIPVSRDRFVLSTDYAILRVVRNPDGRVRGVEWQKGDDSFFMPRVRGPS